LVDKYNIKGVWNDKVIDKCVVWLS